ncbi:uncharacterized protein LOC132314924 [Cornus florida]|uniref:uncharacterized protein LOC132314924 n=1 Tax=Cornus florida TaxID=4283 RepID=UPI00289C7914|nr:uncharacterized protein LOC132314924 [Cornus florida]
MEISTRRSSLLISILISALLIQHFSVVQCSKGYIEKKQQKAAKVMNKAAAKVEKTAAKVSRKTLPAATKVKSVPVPVKKEAKPKVAPKVVPVPVVRPGTGKKALEKKWCIPKPETNTDILQNNIDFACGKGGIDCKAIRAGGPCVEPNTPWSHAAFVMNAFYQSTGQRDCNFAGSGVVTQDDPTKGGSCFPNQGQAKSSSVSQKSSPEQAFSGKIKPTPPGTIKKYCLPKQETSPSALQKNIDYACAKIDCKPIQPGGECYEPNTVKDHAAYAMNYYYQLSDRRECDFSNTALVTSENPSTGKCQYPA